MRICRDQRRSEFGNAVGFNTICGSMKQTTSQTVFGALMFVNRVAPIAEDGRLPLVLRHPQNTIQQHRPVCHTFMRKKLAMTLGPLM